MLVLVPISTIVWWVVSNKYIYSDRNSSESITLQHRILTDVKVVVGSLYLMSFITKVLTIAGYRGDWMQTSAKLLDTVAGGMLFAIVRLMTWLPGISTFQMRVLYNQAFSEGIGFLDILAPKLKHF